MDRPSDDLPPPARDDDSEDFAASVAPAASVVPAARIAPTGPIEIAGERPYQKLRRLERESNVARWTFFGGLRASTRSETVTTVLLAANCAVFAAMVTWGVGFMEPSTESLLTWGALRPLLTRDGQPWRLLTACFLHIGVIHLAVNMYSLWSLRFVETWFGHLGFAVLYLVTGLFASLASTAFGDPFVPGAGASGAIFGVFGAVLGAVLRWKRLGVDSRVTGPILKGVFSTLLLNAVIALSVRNLDHFAHAGGLASGIVLGYALAHAPTPEAVAGRRRRGMATAALSMVVVAAITFALQRPGLAAAGERVETVRTDEDEMGRFWLSAAPPTRPGGPGDVTSDAQFQSKIDMDWLPYIGEREADLRRTRETFPELKKGIDAELARYRALRALIAENSRASAALRRPR